MVWQRWENQETGPGTNLSVIKGAGSSISGPSEVPPRAFVDNGEREVLT